ncbi:MAG: J domain-containing protein [Nanoarchaeota archaeon]
MTKIKLKGHEFDAISVKDSFQRKTVQFRNKIIDTLSKLGLTEDDEDIPINTLAIKKAPAFASWYFNGYRLHYSYQGAAKFVDNLYVVFKVIELEVSELLDEKKTVDEFIREFSEDDDVEAQRNEARETLGVSHDTLDLGLIDKKFKALAKEHHPDMPNGDHDKFKAINRAHKILKRELQ